MTKQEEKIGALLVANVMRLQVTPAAIFRPTSDRSVTSFQLSNVRPFSLLVRREHYHAVQQLDAKHEFAKFLREMERLLGDAFISVREERLFITGINYAETRARAEVAA